MIFYLLYRQQSPRNPFFVNCCLILIADNWFLLSKGSMSTLIKVRERLCFWINVFHASRPLTFEQVEQQYVTFVP